MKKFNGLILSKDRACQLDLLLKSLQKNDGGLFNYDVLYAVSDDNYAVGYEVLKDTYDRVKFIEQTKSLQEHFLAIFSSDYFANGTLSLTSVWTDDTVLFRPVETNAEVLTSLFNNVGVICFSFRLGLNTLCQNCLTGEQQPPLYDFTNVGSNIIVWDRALHHPLSNYGYPYSWDGIAYRSMDLMHWAEKVDFKSIRDFEAQLSCFRPDLMTRRFLASFTESKCVCIPANIVQDASDNFEAKDEFSQKTLNDRFLKADRLSLDKMDFSKVVGCHQQIPLVWE